MINLNENLNIANKSAGFKKLAAFMKSTQLAISSKAEIVKLSLGNAEDKKAADIMKLIDSTEKALKKLRNLAAKTPSKKADEEALINDMMDIMKECYANCTEIIKLAKNISVDETKVLKNEKSTKNEENPTKSLKKTCADYVKTVNASLNEFHSMIDVYIKQKPVSESSFMSDYADNTDFNIPDESDLNQYTLDQHEELMRKKYPEKFNPDGSRKRDK